MIFDTKPTVIGHRGFGSGESGGCREKTIDSYLAAVSHGLSLIELDVQQSLTWNVAAGPVIVIGR